MNSFTFFPRNFKDVNHQTYSFTQFYCVYSLYLEFLPTRYPKCHFQITTFEKEIIGFFYVKLEETSDQFQVLLRVQLYLLFEIIKLFKI